MGGEDFDKLEPFRQIVVGVIKQQGRSDKELACAIGCERSYLSKVRHGTRSLNAKCLEKLVIELKIDRKRMVLAAAVLGTPMIYFNPAFHNISHFITTLLTAVTAIASDDKVSGGLIASIPKDRCEYLAQQAVCQLSERFSSVDTILTIKVA